MLHSSDASLPPRGAQPFVCWDCILDYEEGWDFLHLVNGRMAEPYEVDQSRVIWLFDQSPVAGWPVLLGDEEIRANEEGERMRALAREVEMGEEMEVDAPAAGVAGSKKFGPGYPEVSQSLVAFAPGTAPAMMTDEEVRLVRRERLSKLRDRLRAGRGLNEHIEGFDSESESKGKKVEVKKMESEKRPKRVSTVVKGAKPGGVTKSRSAKSRPKQSSLSLAERIDLTGMTLAERIRSPLPGKSISKRNG